MIELPKTKIWTGDGFVGNPVTLNQVMRNENVAIYERRQKDLLMGYEVFIIKKRKKGDPLPGGAFEPEDREVYPSANTFGRTAWSYGARGAAKVKFEELTAAGVAKLAAEDEEEVVKVAVKLPEGEYSCKELSEKLGISYMEAYKAIKDGVKAKTIVFTEMKACNKKGKEVKYFKTV